MSKKKSKEEALVELLKSRKELTLKAKYGKQQGPLVLCPVKDPVTGGLLGVKVLSEDEKKKEARVVDGNTSRKITNDITFRYDNIIDRTDWEWIVHNKEIAASREDALQEEVVLFYVDDYKAELEKSVKKKEIIFQAQSLVHKASRDRRLEVCRLFGMDGSYMEPGEVFEFLYDKATNFPEKTIAKFEDDDVKHKILMMDLVNSKVIVKDDETGVYVYGSTKLGSKDETVVQWLKDPQNQDIVREMMIDLAS